MFNYSAFFAEFIETTKREGRYRILVDIERIAGCFPQALYHHPDGRVRNITVWCSSDHLGMGQHPKVLAAMRASLENSGVAAGGSRNIAGTNHFHVLLEREIAELHRKEQGLTFVTGYAANDAALSVLGKLLPDCVFVSDEASYASMIYAMRSTTAERCVFRHNDVEHLDRLLSGLDRDRPKVVAFESIYSMDGDLARVADLCAVARNHGALVYLDETHAVGMYGPGGAGLAAERGCAADVTLLMGTFAKGYGAAGGYVVGPESIVDAIRCVAPSFNFTTALPPPLAAAALTSVRHLRQSDTERQLLHRRAAMLKRLLRCSGIPVVSEQSHIVPVLVGNAHRCKQLANRLLHLHQMYLQPIDFPSVPTGTERLRINPSPAHQPDDVLRLTQAISREWSELGISRTSAAQ
ncbi:5-aminolevulinate synthase [Amycolatopsis sp. NPDC049868]|uniref:5-aminolevulinate synthase n=1 Tax=Amycolatopsis sp. NPDC049868 TaxID=3363934 RepID=UPI0037A25432